MNPGEAVTDATPTPRFGGMTVSELRSYHPSTYGPGEVIHDLIDEIERLRNAISKSSGWIPLTESQPPVNQFVLGYYKDGGILPVTRMDGNRYATRSGYFFNSLTHWMPLPEAPK
jgi:hypothetical protein